MKKFLLISFSVFLLFICFSYFGNGFFRLFESNRPSVSLGTTSAGSLENGKRLPSWCNNYVTYSYLGSSLGRNAVHSNVRDLLLATFDTLYALYPERVYVYGETAWTKGGRFWPHKTHQNGLSVDIMTPVTDLEQNSVPLPSSVFNKFGYSINFDQQGGYRDYRIDYESMAAHIYYLYRLAPKYNIKINRIIFYPEFQRYLRKTKFGEYIIDNVRFNKKQSWVIHDDHYHIDFEIFK